MAAPQVNGDLPNASHSSAFIQHLLDYPIVSDGVHTFKSHELGQRSIALTDSAYKTLSSSVLPYFRRPYGYVSPYVARADSLGDSVLDGLDARFPAVKKPTGELYNDTVSFVLLPYNKTIEGRDYVLQVYSSEFKKTSGEAEGTSQPAAGVVAYGKAAVTTALVVSNDTLSWISSFLTAKKAEAANSVNEKVNQ